MSFVPIIVQPPQPSPRARELSRRIAEAVDRFRGEHPDMSPSEIRQALNLVSMRTGTSQAALIGILLAVALVGALVLLFFARG